MLLRHEGEVPTNGVGDRLVTAVPPREAPSARRLAEEAARRPRIASLKRHGTIIANCAHHARDPRQPSRQIDLPAQRAAVLTKREREALRSVRRPDD